MQDLMFVGMKNDETTTINATVIVNNLQLGSAKEDDK